VFLFNNTNKAVVELYLANIALTIQWFLVDYDKVYWLL